MSQNVFQLYLVNQSNLENIWNLQICRIEAGINCTYQSNRSQLHLYSYRLWCETESNGITCFQNRENINLFSFLRTPIEIGYIEENPGTDAHHNES
jgi:hypothetical protein